MSVKVRNELHDLVGQLSDEAAAQALAYLRWLLREERLRITLEQAPIDDEPETEEERAAVAEAEEALARGEVVSHEEVYRQFGL